MKRASTSDYVFVGRGGERLRSIRNAFETACKEAGLHEVSPHTLRHTFASRLAMAGVDARTIQDLGGWKTLALVERYSHLSPSHRPRRLNESLRIPQLFQQQPVAAEGRKA
jgi:site-specific recombinase XerD